MKEQILKLKEDGKSYNEIAKIVGCSKSTISYYCGKDQRKKSSERQKKRRKENPLSKKLDHYKNRKSLDTRVGKFQMRLDSSAEERNGSFATSRSKVKFTFNKNDVLEKFGDSPECYLTGRKINWIHPESYSFDHILPVSKGGDNSLSNLGLAHPDVNFAKGNLTIEEFVSLCKEVVEKFK